MVKTFALGNFNFSLKITFLKLKKYYEYLDLNSCFKGNILKINKYMLCVQFCSPPPLRYVTGFLFCIIVLLKQFLRYGS